MAWSRLEDTFCDHYKPRRLAKALGVRRAEARGWVSRLWAWATTNAKDGNLVGYDADDIANACDLEGDITPVEFCAALLQVQLLDGTTDGNMKIHDWMEYAEGYKAAERKAKSRAKKNVPGQSRDSHVTVPSDRTGQDRTGQDRTRQDPCNKTGETTHIVALKRSKGAVSSNTNGKFKKDVMQVYAHYLEYHPRATPKLSSKAREYRLICAALESGIGVEGCCEAIDGYHRSPFHQGLNDRNQKYLGLGLIFRDSDHVSRGREMATDEVLVSLKSEKQLREKLAVEKWVRTPDKESTIDQAYNPKPKWITDGNKR